MDANKRNFIISAVGYHLILLWGEMFKFSWTDNLSIWEQHVFTVAERFRMGLGFFGAFKSEKALLDMALNCLIFIPSGIYLGAVMKSWKAVFSGLFLTAFVEFTQLFSGLGGFSLTDIFSNFVGAGVGVLIFKAYLCRVDGKLLNRVNQVTAILFSLISVYAIISVIVVFPKYYEWVK
jgi:glycopeptide antibiotics resistance protein